MIILGLDTSSKTASAALWQDGKIRGEFFTNTGFTHSQTIMPMTEHLLQQTGIALAAVDLFAVACGPGSFTGLRIGISAVKGMAYGLSRRCVGVSTLEAAAYSFLGFPAYVVPVMDARRGQVYTASFETDHDDLHRLCEDRAISLEELAEDIIKLPRTRPVYIMGDGAELFCQQYKNPGHVFLAPDMHRYQKAAGVCQAVARADRANDLDPADLAPRYLRLPQAERERLQKEGE